MADRRVPDQGLIVEQQLNLGALWKAEKLRAYPGALILWERQLFAWSGKAPLDPDLWGHLQNWAKKSGILKSG